MFYEILSFSLPKIGEAEKTIQDRFESNLDGNLAALADGAGSSLYPGKWAEILVQSFCHSPEDSVAKLRQSYQEWLEPLQEEWRQYYLAKLRNPKRKWWEGGSQIKSHGSATFIGLRLHSLDGLDGLEQRQWQAVAVGDSCLFKLESETQNLLAFPLKNSQAFKGTTQCFESLPEYSSFPPQFEEGAYDEGDTFLLATDALAQWILTDYENQGYEWQKMFELKTLEDFVIAIAHLRCNNLIKNDDTTVALIKSPAIL